MPIGGESTGGGLAAALALRVRDRGKFAIGRQILAYPMLDDRSAVTPGMADRRHGPWNQSANKFGWSAYLGNADPNVAVPARHGDLTGLAPA
jgi:acetyl esterase/lipase